MSKKLIITGGVFCAVFLLTIFSFARQGAFMFKAEDIAQQESSTFLPREVITPGTESEQQTAAKGSDALKLTGPVYVFEEE